LTEPRHSVLAQHSQVVNNGTCYQVCIVVTSCQLLGIAVTYTPGGSIGSNHRTAVPRPLKCCCTSIKDCRTPDCKEHAPKCSRCCTSSATGISYRISQIHALAYHTTESVRQGHLQACCHAAHSHCEGCAPCT
jgi:hypothetical protein